MTFFTKVSRSVLLDYLVRDDSKSVILLAWCLLKCFSSKRKLERMKLLNEYKLINKVYQGDKHDEIK